MKYKVGDKVKIKYRDSAYHKDIIGTLKKYNYILTIKNIRDNTYSMEAPNGKISYQWGDCHIECLYIEPEPILSRFEILDL